MQTPVMLMPWYFFVVAGIMQGCLCAAIWHERTISGEILGCVVGQLIGGTIAFAISSHMTAIFWLFWTTVGVTVGTFFANRSMERRHRKNKFRQ